jgi:hypothetical protein
MRTRVERRTVNLSAYPDLVVIYLGMRVNRITGIMTRPPTMQPDCSSGEE